MARKDRNGDGVHMRGMFLFIFAPQYWLTNFIHRRFFPPLTLTTISASPFLLPPPQP